MLIFAGNWRIMLRYISLLSLLLFPLSLWAQFMHSPSPDVRTLRMELNGEWDALPVITLGSDDAICFSFDELSHTYKRYTYHVVHCNADWTPSDLHEIDYLEGLNGLVIEEWENSVATTQLYTHYSFSLPNENLSLLLSGNYKVEVYDDESDNEAPVARFCFSVVEPRVGVTASVSGDTDLSLNDGEQQVSFTVDCSGYSIASPSTDIIPVVYQNRRMDNAVLGVKPTYITGNTLEYVHNERLIFNAGNEYRRFELTDPNSPALNVEDVVTYGDEYHALLYIDKPRVTHSNYVDENGRYYVRTLEGRGSPIEADYVHVHFALDAPYSVDGDYYLFGELSGNVISPVTKLDYDVEEGYYHTTLLLKLGLYNYIYVWMPHGGDELSNSAAEGDFYNTDNEYLVYIYHRELGARYDRLIGVRSLNYTLEGN